MINQNTGVASSTFQVAQNVSKREMCFGQGPEAEDQKRRSLGHGNAGTLNQRNIFKKGSMLPKWLWCVSDSSYISHLLRSPSDPSWQKNRVWRDADLPKNFQDLLWWMVSSLPCKERVLSVGKWSFLLWQLSTSSTCYISTRAGCPLSSLHAKYRMLCTQISSASIVDTNIQDRSAKYAVLVYKRKAAYTYINEDVADFGDVPLLLLGGRTRMRSPWIYFLPFLRSWWSWGVAPETSNTHQYSGDHVISFFIL